MNKMNVLRRCGGSGIKLSIILSAILIMMPFVATNSFAQLVVEKPTFNVIDISGTDNPTDFPYGITCDDANWRLMTLFSQGGIVRIEKSTGNVTLHDLNPGVDAGEDFYSVVIDPVTGLSYVSFKDFGLVVTFDPDTGDWGTPFPTVPNIAGGIVSYHTTYEDAPYSFDVAGFGQVAFGFESYGELKAANNFIWQVVDAEFDFPAGSGAPDSAFHGVVRIDPTDNSIVRTSIPGATGLRGITIDTVNSDIAWISDINTDKIHKFNMTSLSVVYSIDLPAGTMPRGMSNTNGFLFVSSNQNAGAGNSEIIKIDKNTNATSVIDTGAINSDGGTFSVFTDATNDILIWTDVSGHTGTIQLSDETKKTVANTTEASDANHFGCFEGNKFYFSGKGSVVEGSFSFSGAETGSNGGGCAGDCYKPHFGMDDRNINIYDDGLTINGMVYDINNELHVNPGQKLIFPVGQPINVTMKLGDSWPEQITHCELAMGIEHGKYNKQAYSTFIVNVDRTWDGVITTDIEGDATALRDLQADMQVVGDNMICSILLTPTKHLQYDMLAISVWDMFLYENTRYINDGILFRGVSEVGTPIFTYMDNNGIIYTLTIVDVTLEDMTLARDQNGDYWRGDFGKFWNKDFIMPDMSCPLTTHGYKRYCPEFQVLKQEQETIAIRVYGFNSTLIQSVGNPSFAYEITNYGPLHDSIPNMNKAFAEYQISKFDTRNLSTYSVE